MMQLQEIFDKVVRALIEQGEKSDIEGRCQYIMYRHDKVLRCAIGHLVTEEEAKRMDGSVYEGLIRSSRSLCEIVGIAYNENQSDTDENSIGIDRVRLRFLEDLQLAHDNANGHDFVRSVKVLLKDLAVKFDLKQDVLE